MSTDKNGQLDAPLCHAHVSSCLWPYAYIDLGFLPKLLVVPLLHLPQVVIRQHGPFILLPWGDCISVPVNASKLVYHGQLFILMFFLSFLCLSSISSCFYIFSLFSFVSFFPSLFLCLPLNMSFFSLPLTIPATSVEEPRK